MDGCNIQWNFLTRKMVEGRRMLTSFIVQGFIDTAIVVILLSWCEKHQANNLFIKYTLTSSPLPIRIPLSHAQQVVSAILLQVFVWSWFQNWCMAMYSTYSPTTAIIHWKGFCWYPKISWHLSCFWCNLLPRYLQIEHTLKQLTLLGFWLRNIFAWTIQCARQDTWLLSRW